ncbi:cation:proton antiporter, partial [Acinetobacter baumannii]
EFDAQLMKSKAKGALAVSLSGIAAPFVLGAMCAVWLHNDKTFFPPKVQFLPAMLYMGAAMCITAFPMLARIIREKGIAGTSMGTLALA